jgi:hypothetical protein
MRRPNDTDKINEILHFAKAAKSFHKLFADLTEDWKEWVPFAGRTRFNPDAYLACSQLVNLHHWMRKFVLMCRFLDMRRYYVDELADICQQIQSPEAISTVEAFGNLLKHFTAKVKFLDQDVTAKTMRLTCTESIRLDEALVCYDNYCFYASVIMAVSAVESRITELMRKSNPRLFTFTFSKSTLGQLIQVFEPDKYTDKKYARIKRLMPDKHRPLVALLNQYRVLSADRKSVV